MGRSARTISENSGYDVGIYGARNVCRRFIDAGYASVRRNTMSDVHVTQAVLARYDGEGPDAGEYGEELMGLYNVLENYNALSRAE